ncbi:hypothetical protein Patl1_14845 [Pistacia atlantica]|uniref:Uncharacterized protein n=1 Tax=Pistacia atlantica TaxID=434234 RepID=A0ACC1AS16_9ROSI|nr:hypothetical protein Patl1_14845 [Pistacia atlantica]
MVTVTDMIDGVILLREKKYLLNLLLKWVHEQHGNMAPAARMAMTRKVHPLVSLNPYQGNWTIKVLVTSKGNMLTYKNARGEGCVFNYGVNRSRYGYFGDFADLKFTGVLLHWAGSATEWIIAYMFFPCFCL